MAMKKGGLKSCALWTVAFVILSLAFLSLVGVVGLGE